jgi:hypothetical protein
MNRGPAALFGAIVAVGFGPALWLGAQFGTGVVTPVRPPVTVEQQVPQGGGAGAAPNDTTPVLSTETGLPRSAAAPTSAAPTAQTRSDRTSAPPAVPRATITPTPKPSVSSSAAPSTAPTESTESPTAPTEPVPQVPLTGVDVAVASR